MVSAFCERLGWLDLETLVTRFQSRVFYGVRQEIVALTEIPYIKGKGLGSSGICLLRRVSAALGRALPLSTGSRARC